MFTTLKNRLTDENIIFKNKTIFQEKNFDEIRDWVNNNLDKFRLNEAHSCIVERDGFNITITGDEDRIEFTLNDTIKDAIIL
jgi:hypothetical protein